VAASSEIGRGELGPFVEEFGRLVRRTPAREEDTQVLSFISTLTAEARPAFEALMRKDVDAGFAVHEQGPGGILRLAGSRPHYYPVTVIEHAVTSGRRTASAVVDLPLSASGPEVVWNFLPIYRSESASGTTAARAGLVRICASAFRIDQMVETSLKELSPAGIDLELLDGNAPAGKQALYYHRSRVPGYVTSSVVKTGLKRSTTINAGERTWILIAYPTTRFISQHRTWQSWTILAGGLLLSGLSGIIFLGRLRRATRCTPPFPSTPPGCCREPWGGSSSTTPRRICSGRRPLGGSSRR